MCRADTVVLDERAVADNGFAATTQSASLAYRPAAPPGHPPGLAPRGGAFAARRARGLCSNNTIRTALSITSRWAVAPARSSWTAAACEHEVHGKTALASSEWANRFLTRQRGQVGRPRPVGRTRWLGELHGGRARAAARQVSRGRWILSVQRPVVKCLLKLLKPKAEKKAKSSASSLPAWSPTAVLPELDPA